MGCAKIKRLVGRYIDKELMDKRTAAWIEIHSKQCPDCQAEFASLLKIKALISEKQRLVVKEDFLFRLKKRLTLAPQVIKIRWVIETGDLARRLIPVPALIMLLVICLLFVRYNGLNPVDDYIFGDLTGREIAIVDGEMEENDFSTEVLLEGYQS